MLDSLRAITQEVNAADSLEAAMKIIVNRTRLTMSTQMCSIYLRNEHEEFVLRATEGLNATAVNQVKVTREVGLIGYVARRGEPINLENAREHPQYRYFPETGEERFSSFLGVPIVHQREVLGVLAVQQGERRRFDDAEEAFLVTLCAQLSGLIAHTEAIHSADEIDNKSIDVRFKGVAGSPGVSIGTAVVFSPEADLDSVPYQKCTDTEGELTFFFSSLIAARNDIKALGSKLKDRLSSEEQGLFDAYLAMLDDTSLAREVTEDIKQGVVAPYAWSRVILNHAQTFASMHDPYLRERAADVRDLGRRVLAYLQNSPNREKDYPDNTVLLGDELTASVLGEIPKDKLVGLVSVKGSGNSHIAILARAMGIPTVMGVVDLPFTQLEGHSVVVDGYRGNIYFNPSEEMIREFKILIQEDYEITRHYETLRHLPCETLDNHRVPLWVNTGLMADILRSIERGAEGVGLYRTEVPFLLRDRFPTEEDQRKIYREHLETFAPHTVTMRTLDVGGDKSLSYFPIEEANPFLGWRGIRVTLDHPEIFLAQVRAMMKASEGLNNLRIMLPMVSHTSELEMAQTLIHRAHAELLEEGGDIELPPIGVMIEVPAAVYQAKELAARADFLSVGSNDLTQYLLAVDRNNPRVADLYNSYHPAVLQALQYVVKAAHSQGTPVSICGELAGDPGAAILLMAMGYDVLSMNSTNLPRVKSVIRAITLDQAERLLTSVMKLADATIINQYVERTIRRLGVKDRPESLDTFSLSKEGCETS
ncbi:phosphoenolpyruvate--protein phosphotransferase [Candidatus Endobugula sertula]|uniref:phosphoenolpyruvate--protein phosphotransferase n=1 Tax=Candidatus Endobugula sertula TaxID=62101 RepID=A0A1D2QTB6_9GAMM|nr:phosphoenolpyruvate--protein phosphotransferase [Candidatus Endobugula sertula]